MKRKAFRVALTIGVILIWLFVFKKTFSFLGAKDATVSYEVNTELATHTVPEFNKDTFEIKSYKRDIFLDFYEKNKTPYKKPVKTGKAIVKKVATKKVIAKLQWPKLQYFGYLKSGDETRKLALIKINNKLNRVREKQNIDDIYVQAVFKDSVMLKMNGEMKTITK